MFRKWYFEKRDWIVSDEIEDEAEEMTEDELVAEEEIVIPTVAVEDEKKENSICPVCRESFDTFYKQVGSVIDHDHDDNCAFLRAKVTSRVAGSCTTPRGQRTGCTTPSVTRTRITPWTRVFLTPAWTKVA